MARYVVLNNVMHKGLRVVTRFGSEFGDDVGMVPAFPTEYAELQREYPIFLRRDGDGDAWQSVALLGFAQRENLFVQDGRWNANYLPGAIAKGPFLIGFQETRADGELRNEAVIHVDMEHPHIGRGEGEAVFLPQGGHSAYLEHVITVLRGIRDGAEAAGAMFAAFDSLGLIQPMTMELKFDDQHGANLTGLHGIDRERLAGLDATSVHRLHQAGYLEGAYLLLSSLHNMRRLIAEKQRRLRLQDAATEHAA